MLYLNHLEHGDLPSHWRTAPIKQALYHESTQLAIEGRGESAHEARLACWAVIRVLDERDEISFEQWRILTELLVRSGVILM